MEGANSTTRPLRPVDVQVVMVAAAATTTTTEAEATAEAVEAMATTCVEDKTEIVLAKERSHLLRNWTRFRKQSNFCIHFTAG